MVRYIIPVILLPNLSFSQAITFDTIYSNQISSSDERFEATIEAYKNSEIWRIWSFPMENKLDSASISHEKWKTMDYYIQNLNDLNLNTSWSRKNTDTIKKIEFQFNFKPGQNFYSSAYQFFGQINLFNGNLESYTAWTEHGRLKTLKVYYNQKMVCFVRLLDTWQFQYFTIEQYFKNRYFKKYLDAPYEIKTGDKLTFEVVDFYPGTKYTDFAVSEFLIEGAKN